MLCIDMKKLLTLSLFIGGLLLIGVSFFLWDCSKGSWPKGYNSYSSFPVEEKLKSRTVELDTAIFRYPFRISVKGDVAFLMDLHNLDHYYHAFTYPEFRYLASFGKRGEAPGEVLSGENVRCVTLDSIWTLDSDRGEIDRWSFSPDRSKIELVEPIRLDREVVRALDFTQLSDSTFLIPCYTGEYRYNVVDRKGKIICRVGTIPNIEGKTPVSPPALAQAWRSFVDYNPQNGILAMVTQLGEVLEIVNLKDTTKHFISIGPNGVPEYEAMETEAIPTGIMGFSDVHVTDKYIYTVFHGRHFKDIDPSNPNRQDGGRYIYVFDLEGNPVQSFELDHYVYAIYLDPIRNKMIALDVNMDQPVLEYPFPEVKK